MERHPGWKGGKMLTTHGYVLTKVFNRKNHDKKGYMLEHRVIMEDKIGRPLNKWEQVNHLNGIRTDNRPENLELVQKNRHYGKVLCPYCDKSFFIK
jgi:hypothetical protein